MTCISRPNPGVGIDWHIENKLGGNRSAAMGHGGAPRLIAPSIRRSQADPAVLISTAKEMAEFLHSKNPAVNVHLMATWPRADQTFDPKRRLVWEAYRGHGTGRTCRL
jgi:hypothetical protein